MLTILDTHTGKAVISTRGYWNECKLANRSYPEPRYMLVKGKDK